MIDRAFFDRVIDRSGTSSFKWDAQHWKFGSSDLLPFWVADMEFACPPEVTEALQDRAAHGIYGYTLRGDAWKESFTGWMSRRHHLETEDSWVLFAPGVMPAIASIIDVVTRPGDRILVQPPVYHPFYEAIEMNHRRIVRNPLQFEGDRYTMDFEHLETLLRKEEIVVALLCSPHNPVGRVWTADELKRYLTLCEKHNVLVVSDEIHCDLTLFGNRHQPALGLTEETGARIIGLYSVSKTFNLAGLQMAAMVIPDENLRKTLGEALYARGMFLANTFGITAWETAYRSGDAWLDTLIPYLERNYSLMRETFTNDNSSSIGVMPCEGTYLGWLDFRDVGDETQRILLEDARVALYNGNVFGPEGEGFFRINFAVPESMLREGIERMSMAFGKGVGR